MRRSRLSTVLLLCVAFLIVGVGQALAQLPPEAVLLDKVKIPETIKAGDPFKWTYEDAALVGQEAEPPSGFPGDAAAYTKAATRERYVQNFMLAMSTIWCPITDEVTPGGRKRVEGHGYDWESCCSFCDEEMLPENFGQALEDLRKRAETSYELTGGRYTEGASSPVEGAIDENV